MGDNHRCLSTSEDSNNSITAQASHVHAVVADEGRELEASPAYEVSIQIIPSPTEAPVRRRRIHKVPRPLREEFKAEILNRFVSDSGAKDKGFFYNKILERIDEIRGCYEEDSTAVFSDEALAEMILLDACFTIYYLQSKYRDYHRLGTAVVIFMYRDILMLENQIPLWTIRLLIDLKYGKDKGEAWFCEHLSTLTLGDDRLTQIPWDNGDEPLHLLEACRRIILLGQEKATECIRDLDSRRKELRQRRSFENMFKMATSQFRSVTDLKAKGVDFKPSSNCLTDIRFRSYSFYGLLELPVRYVTNNSMVSFSNMIAFEMCPETDTGRDVISYVNFMKSLIETPGDVKVLREKGILFSRLGSDEEVVKMFKQMDTFGAEKSDQFLDVKMRIEQHCNSKAKTWMAELIHAYFLSPWTAVALFAATFLLCLTFLQTFYTIPPPN
ncbi:UNVERIFIED_CONTAM: hypothetical protein Sradi_4451100 [Sesamum radiatum]|uniref:Uncharacterized protein n=1 Tax=Sesamum radiatum TaxID=300843 RepID=A0AAW2NS36_SESRA